MDDLLANPACEGSSLGRLGRTRSESPEGQRRCGIGAFPVALCRFRGQEELHSHRIVMVNDGKAVATVEKLPGAIA